MSKKFTAKMADIYLRVANSLLSGQELRPDISKSANRKKLLIGKFKEFLNSNEGKETLELLNKLSVEVLQLEAHTNMKSDRNIEAKDDAKSIMESTNENAMLLRSRLLNVLQDNLTFRPNQPQQVFTRSDPSPVEELSDQDVKLTMHDLATGMKLNNDELNAVHEIIKGKTTPQLIVNSGLRENTIKNILGGLALISSGIVGNFNPTQKNAVRLLGSKIGKLILSGTIYSGLKSILYKSGSIKREELKKLTTIDISPKPSDIPSDEPSDKDKLKKLLDKNKKVLKQAKTSKRLSVEDADKRIEKIESLEQALDSKHSQAVMDVIQNAEGEIEVVEVENAADLDDLQGALRSTDLIVRSLVAAGGISEIVRRSRSSLNAIINRVLPTQPPAQQPTQQQPTQPPTQQPPSPSPQPSTSPIFTPTQIPTPTPPTSDPIRPILPLKIEDKIVKTEQDTHKLQESDVPSQSRPAFIIPATEVLNPLNADQMFDAFNAFGYHIPHASDGTLLENNPLKLDNMIFEKLRYNGGGIKEYNNDFNSVIQGRAQLEKKVNMKNVPRMQFDEFYEVMPYNPNVELEQNILYNNMTDVRSTDGNDESIRQSILYGRQP